MGNMDITSYRTLGHLREHKNQDANGACGWRQITQFSTSFPSSHDMELKALWAGVDAGTCKITIFIISLQRENQQLTSDVCW